MLRKEKELFENYKKSAYRKLKIKEEENEKKTNTLESSRTE